MSHNEIFPLPRAHTDNLKIPPLTTSAEIPSAPPTHIPLFVFTSILTHESLASSCWGSHLRFHSPLFALWVGFWWYNRWNTSRFQQIRPGTCRFEGYSAKWALFIARWLCRCRVTPFYRISATKWVGPRSRFLCHLEGEDSLFRFCEFFLEEVFCSIQFLSHGLDVHK